MTSMLLVALGAPFGTLFMATLLAALLAPRDRSAKCTLPRSQWPGDPMPGTTFPRRESGDLAHHTVRFDLIKPGLESGAASNSARAK